MPDTRCRRIDRGRRTDADVAVTHPSRNEPPANRGLISLVLRRSYTSRKKRAVVDGWVIDASLWSHRPDAIRSGESTGIRCLQQGDVPTYVDAKGEFIQHIPTGARRHSTDTTSSVSQVSSHASRHVKAKDKSRGKARGNAGAHASPGGRVSVDAAVVRLHH